MLISGAVLIRRNFQTIFPKPISALLPRWLPSAYRLALGVLDDLHFLLFQLKDGQVSLRVQKEK